MIDKFVKKCKEDFWYYPKWSLCYSLMVFSIMAAFDIGVI